VPGLSLGTSQRPQLVEDDLGCQVGAAQRQEDSVSVILVGHELAPSVLVVPPSPLPAQQDGSTTIADARRRDTRGLLTEHYGEEPETRDNRLLQEPSVLWPTRVSGMNNHDLQSARMSENSMMVTSSLSPSGIVNSARARTARRFALTFPDLVPSDCEVQPDFTFLFFITIVRFR